MPRLVAWTAGALLHALEASCVQESLVSRVHVSAQPVASVLYLHFQFFIPNLASASVSAPHAAFSTPAASSDRYAKAEFRFSLG